MIHPSMKNVILYILTKNIQDLGKKKLAKLLFFIDREYWMVTSQKHFLGCDFLRMPYGPLPLSFYKDLDGLIKTGIILVEKEKYHGKEISLIKLSSSVNVQHLIQDIGKIGISVCNFVLKRDGAYSAKQLEDITHDSVWKKSNNKDITPYASYARMRWEYFKDKPEGELSANDIASITESLKNYETSQGDLEVFDIDAF